MKYCSHCGSEISDETMFCTNCGQSTAVTQKSSDTKETLRMVVKIFLIIACVSQGWMIIPLAWCIPMTISIFNNFKENKPVSIAMKICTLLFVSMVAGVCLLCMNDEEA